MLKSLLSNKEKLLELANTPLNENCSAVILKKLPEKLGDPGKFLIPCGFSELKCKALADLGASINLMPLSVWKKLGLPELISTRMTLELANRAICTPAGIARDVFVPVGKFTFPADFVIVDYESDPRVPLILGRPFLRTARALIDVHREEMILRDGDERLILNMRHDTSSYSNKPKKESINMIDIYNVSHKDYLEDLFANEKATNHQSGNPTFSSHTDLTSPEVINPLSGNPTPISEPVTKSSSSPTITSFEESELIWEEFEAYLASDSFPPGNDDPVDLLLEEFADELALITFPPGNDDLPFDIESDLREIEYLLNNDPTKEMDSILEDSVDEGNLANPNNDLVDTIPEMFSDEHTLDYSSPPLYDDVDDDPVELESDNDDCDSVFYEDFSEVDALSSTNNEDKIFNPGILIHENLFVVTNYATPEKNVKKATNASLILEDFNPPLDELPFHKEVPEVEALLSFSSENEEKVFNPGILTSKRLHTSLLPKLSHRGTKAFKVTKILKSPMKIFPCSYQEDIRVLDVPCTGYSLKDKNKAKPDKTESGIRKSAKNQSQRWVINPDLLTKDIMGFKTYENYKDDWIYEWNKDVPWVDEKPWTDTGVWTEPAPVKHTCKPFDYKTGCSEWPTCSWKDDGYCNGGNLPGTYIIGNQLHYQDYEWYKAIKDSEVKDEALRNKAIMEGLINEDDDESRYEQKKQWNMYTNYDDAYEINHRNNEKEELCEVHELPTCNIRRYMMIKYSFNNDEEYVAVKEDEYDDLTITRKEACQAYQKNLSNNGLRMDGN
ncbi:reverse transcriptase domain-containing protein [Tanacetum coccineum]